MTCTYGDIGSQTRSYKGIVLCLIKPFGFRWGETTTKEVRPAYVIPTVTNDTGTRSSLWREDVSHCTDVVGSE